MHEAKFGPAGSCERSAEEKIKSTEKLIEWIAAQGLTAFEYQCGRGVMVKEPKARIFRDTAEPGAHTNPGRSKGGKPGRREKESSPDGRGLR